MKYGKITHEESMSAIEVLDKHITIFKELIKNLETIEVKPGDKINESLRARNIDIYKKEIAILENAKQIIR